MKKKTVTIAIPAFNEEKNIVSLLKVLLKQRNNNYRLESIIVLSDGSTDETVSRASSLQTKKLVIVERKQRRGLAFSQNELCSYAHSDILVILNADIIVTSKNFIQGLIKPIIEGADLTSSRIIPVKSRKNFLQNVLYISMLYKNDIFDNFNQGNNVYTCHGPVRAFSKRLYKKITFPSSVGEDMYSYFYTKNNKYSYIYNKCTYVYYTLPSTFKDHENQSIRFFKSVESMQKRFRKNIISNELSTPFSLTSKVLVHYLFKYPLSMSAYMVLIGYMIIKSRFTTISFSIWNEVKSSRIIPV